jgi:ferredoxin-like protein FixX
MPDWEKYIAVAGRFQHKAWAKVQDREDLKHTIILKLAQVASNNGRKPFTKATMCRIASYVMADYWRSQYKLTNGLDCGSCSQTQRRKCRKDWQYTECPKALPTIG